MLKQVLNYLIILPVIITSAIAEPALTKETDVPQQELLIWRVDSKPGSIYSVYIMGSYHVGKECQINSPALEHAFKDAETVIFEVDSLNDDRLLAQKSQQYMNRVIRQKGIPTDPSNSLQQIVDPETYELLKETTAAIDFPIDNFARLKPWVFIFAFTSTQIAQSEYKPECGLDSMIAELSESENKATNGLESLDYQLYKFTELFISMDSEEISETLSAIADLDSGDELSNYWNREFDSLIDSIDSGDLEVLKSSLDEWCSEDPEECESLLYVRNRNWIPKIEQLLDQNKDSLVVVGAGHLIGEENVIQLLKQKGYKVRRFYNTFRLTEE